jgi:putative membrane protein
MLRFLFYLLVVIVISLGISFACLNASLVQVNYYVGTDSLPLSLLLAICLLLGSIITLLFLFALFIRLKAKQLNLSYQLSVAKKELDNLRIMPLKDEC